MAVVGILLPFTNVPFLDYVGILVAIIGVMWMIMNPVHYAKERKRIADIYCPVCGTKYDWDKDVGCEVTDSEANARITVTGDVKSSAHDTVEFECHCHNCGNVTTFSKRFKTGKGKNGHIQSQSLERLARKYFD